MQGAEKFWDYLQRARREKNYAAAMEHYAAYIDWRSKQTPSTAMLPLGEEDVPGRLVNSWMVGCDPEFVVLDEKNVIVNTDGVLAHNGKVGWDHAGNVVEIRPEPAHGTYALVKRIQKELLENTSLQLLSKHRWRAGAIVKGRIQRIDGMANAAGERTLTLGGHIHIDKPAAGYGGPEEDHRLTISALDRVTKYLEELDILPKGESAARRREPNAVRNRYGQFGDWRPAGGHQERMEYRTMASWLFDPRVAYVALTAAKLAAAQPQVTLDALKDKAWSWQGLRGFFEVFGARDSNARRAVERIFEGHRVNSIQVDPSTGFRERWTRLGI